MPCIEMARTEGRELWAAFHDVEKAHDYIEQATQQQSLSKKGAAQEWWIS